MSASPTFGRPLWSVVDVCVCVCVVLIVTVTVNDSL